jgi:hypothetical protein
MDWRRTKQREEGQSGGCCWRPGKGMTAYSQHSRLEKCKQTGKEKVTGFIRKCGKIESGIWIPMELS